MISKEQANDFLTLMDNDWNEWVSTTAHALLDDSKYNKIVEPPTSPDLVKLTEYLTCGIEEVATTHDEKTFKVAQELVMIRLLTFNKRRQMKVEALRYYYA